MDQIPVFRPLLRDAEMRACVEALELGWLGMGAYVGQFEDGLKTYMEADDRYVVGVSTGHAALHLSMLLLGIGPGDEVITPSFNNIADFQAILATGASPVFCDIDPVTLCIDVDKAEEVVSERTKAVIGMDYDCILCDHDRLNAFATRHGIRVIHDAAHSIGSRYKGKMVGSFSDICMFSFDPVKTITCIDGGALIVKTEEEQKILQEMRLIGMGQAPKVMYQNKRAWTYDVTRVGFRYHLANLHASLGVTQLGQMDAISESRRATCRAYNAQLEGIPEVSVPQTDFEDITPFLYYIRVPADRRQALRDFLLERGVDTGIHWQPGHWFTLLEDCRRGDLSVTELVGTEILSLPLHSMMSVTDQERVIAGVSAFFQH